MAYGFLVSAEGCNDIQHICELQLFLIWIWKSFFHLERITIILQQTWWYKVLIQWLPVIYICIDQFFIGWNNLVTSFISLKIINLEAYKSLQMTYRNSHWVRLIFHWIRALMLNDELQCNTTTCRYTTIHHCKQQLSWRSIIFQWLKATLLILIQLENHNQSFSYNIRWLEEINSSKSWFIFQRLTVTIKDT